MCLYYRDTLKAPELGYLLENNKLLSKSIIMIPPNTCNQEILNPKISARIAHIIVVKVGITISVAIASANNLMSSFESVILVWFEFVFIL